MLWHTCMIALWQTKHCPTPVHCICAMYNVQPAPLSVNFSHCQFQCHGSLSYVLGNLFTKDIKWLRLHLEVMFTSYLGLNIITKIRFFYWWVWQCSKDHPEQLLLKCTSYTLLCDAISHLCCSTSESLMLQYLRAGCNHKIRPQSLHRTVPRRPVILALGQTNKDRNLMVRTVPEGQSF